MQGTTSSCITQQVDIWWLEVRVGLGSLFHSCWFILHVTDLPESLQHTVPVQLELPSLQWKASHCFEGQNFRCVYSMKVTKKKVPKPVWYPNPSPPTDRPDRLSKVANCVSYRPLKVHELISITCQRRLQLCL